MKQEQIAVFDSGLGGLSSMKELLTLLPGENFIYFGDTARVPYGSRSPELIRRFAQQDLRFLLEHRPKAVLVACGTVSSIALNDLRQMTEIPVIGVVEPAAAAAVRATGNRRIGVLGTASTIKSGSYERAIFQEDSSCKVFSQACPLFVPLVENGCLESYPATKLIAADYIAPLQRAQVDTVILGCTHYPLLKPLLSELFGPSVTLIDSGREAAVALCGILKETGNLCEGTKGSCWYYVTDEVANFSRIAEMFLDRHIDAQTEKVTIRTDV